MHSFSPAIRLLAGDAQSLLVRLNLIKPFAMQIPMVSAAAISPAAQVVIERQLIFVRRDLKSRVERFIEWLHSPWEGRPTAEAVQARFSMLKLRFNAVLTQLDIFSDALTQRSEMENGIWLSGLDALAADALALPGNYYDAPPVICYLDRGHGAAIRRARTRLPGGGRSPVAIIRVPRERMVGYGIASSLIHEVGHQGSELLGLVGSLRAVMQGFLKTRSRERLAWTCFNRWITEIICDLWSVAKIGIGATLGLMGVVSLPRAFVFRMNLDDPHPFPWIRVKLSCAMGQALYPHSQWSAVADVWEELYPIARLDPERKSLLALLENAMAGLVSLVAHHRPRSLRGRSLGEALTSQDRRPKRLSGLFQELRFSPGLMKNISPTLAFAVLGQARADGAITPGDESRIVARLLNDWALSGSLATSASTATRPVVRSSAAGISILQSGG